MWNKQVFLFKMWFLMPSQGIPFMLTGEQWNSDQSPFKTLKAVSFVFVLFAELVLFLQSAFQMLMLSIRIYSGWMMPTLWTRSAVTVPWKSNTAPWRWLAIFPSAVPSHPLYTMKPSMVTLWQWMLEATSMSRTVEALLCIWKKQKWSLEEIGSTPTSLVTQVMFSHLLFLSLSLSASSSFLLRAQNVNSQKKIYSDSYVEYAQLTLYGNYLVTDSSATSGCYFFEGYSAGFEVFGDFTVQNVKFNVGSSWGMVYLYYTSLIVHGNTLFTNIHYEGGGGVAGNAFPPLTCSRHSFFPASQQFIKISSLFQHCIPNIRSWRPWEPSPWTTSSSIKPVALFVSIPMLFFFFFF